MANVIELQNINKSFGNHQIFRNLSLEIEKGDFVCITGPSGKGKSTLLNIIGMLDTPDAGTVRISGVENPKLSSRVGRKLLKNELFYVFQNYGLVEDKTVRYNLEIATYFSGKKSNDVLADALTQVGLHQDILNQKIYTLSGGEQQRCALARLYLKNYSIVLADEPTGSLDAVNREKVMEIFKRIHESGKTVIIVTHDAEVTKCAKRVITL